VECIPNQLEILFENIISNAIIYSYNGGSVEIVSNFNRESSSAVVTVIDHGIGIGDKDLPHIFDEYFYAPRAALHNRTSSGIGLSIVKTVAENNKLHIKVSSEHEVGTAFSVLFQYPGNALDTETSIPRTNSGKYLADSPSESTAPTKGGCQPA
jgi:signal transduction histidine kinase